MEEAKLESYSIMVEAIAFRLLDYHMHYLDVEHEIPDSTAGAAEPCLDHLHRSDLEGCAYSLWQLNILELCDPAPDNGWGNYLKFACEPGQAANQAIKNHQKGPTFNKLLEQLIGLFDEHGLFPANRSTAFDLHDERVQTVADQLLRHGYVQKTDVGVVWAEKISPIMVELGNWPDPREEAARFEALMIEHRHSAESRAMISASLESDGYKVAFRKFLQLTNAGEHVASEAFRLLFHKN